MVCVLTLLIAYPLSTGPAVLAARRGLISRGTFQIIYYPLTYLEPIPGFADAMKWNILLWNPGLDPFST